jgi:hypothetical protein
MLQFIKASFLLLLCLALLQGCFTIKTEHEVKPIQITVDVNLRVERELDDLFGDLDAASETLEAPESTEATTE